MEMKMIIVQVKNLKIWMMKDLYKFMKMNLLNIQLKWQVRFNSKNNPFNNLMIIKKLYQKLIQMINKNNLIIVLTIKLIQKMK